MRMSKRSSASMSVGLFNIVFLCAFLCTSFLYAQENTTGGGKTEARPEEPEVDVPPVVFEYTTAPQREIDVLLPETEPLTLPQIEPFLPEPDKMEVGTPDVPIAPPAEIADEGGMGGTFFSEGRIGVGTDNHLLGDISLYKRGEGPHFSIGFSHEGIDGYGRESSGTGYFHREEELSGSFSTNTGGSLLELNGNFVEQEKGLQDYGGATSVIHRFSSAGTRGSLPLGERFSIGAEAAGHYSSRTIAGEVTGGGGFSSPLYDMFLRPETYLVYEDRWGVIRGGGMYEFYRGADEVSFHAAGGEVSLTLMLATMDVTLRGGGLWDEEEGALVPFLLRVEGMPGDLFHYRLEGGYVTERNSYRDLWMEYPLLDTAESLPLTHGWRVEAGMSGSIRNTFDWSLSGSFFAAENIPEPESMDSRDPSDGLFDIVIRDGEVAEGNASIGYRPVEPVSLSLSWRGELLGRIVRPEGRHRFSAEAAYEDSEGRYGGDFTASYSFDPRSDLPIFDTGGHYRISEGVELRVEWIDMLGLLVENGRKTWGKYTDPGMQLRIMTEISL